MVRSRYRTHGCPCGYLTDARKPCKCTPPQVDRYLARISGPLIDRIDIHIEVPAVAYRELRTKQDGRSSQDMREDVIAARDRQRHRFGDVDTTVNASMTTKDVRKHCKIDAAGEMLLKSAMTELGLSARAHDKILRMARTIADLAGRDDLMVDDLTEAIHYRRMDRQL
jgi:magnesium chelatase family protein